MLSSLAALALLSSAASNPLTEVRDSYPAPSPDGTSIAFHSNRSGRVALYLADMDGGNVRVLLDSGDDPVTPAWSHDGSMIAFAATVDGQSEIFVMNADGGGRKRLTDDPGDDSHPHWSADGRIFFNSPRFTPDRSAEWSDQWHDIFSMRPDGSNLVRHTDCRTVCTFPSPSPDNRRIVYRKVVDGPSKNWTQTASERNSEIFVADMDGGNERNITNDPAFDGWPVWASDSKSVIFASNRDGRPYAAQIYAIDVSTQIVTPITADDWSHAQPSPSVDGAVVYSYRFLEGEDFEFGHIAATEVNR